MQNPGQPEPTTNSNLEENSTYTGTLFSNETPYTHKILGVNWNPVSDTLEFDIRATAHSLQTLDPTKRNIAGFSSRFYNPFGYLAPVIIMLKVYFQELCKSKPNWDEPLPTELLHK